jgi:hypothetical protein
MGWSESELAAIEAAIQINLATERNDGSLRRPVAVWVVRVGDDVYVRAVHGPEASWYRGTRTRRAGRLWVVGMEERAIRFATPGADSGDRIDAAYRLKYGSFGPTLDLAVGDPARAATLRLEPA